MGWVKHKTQKSAKNTAARTASRRSNASNTSDTSATRVGSSVRLSAVGHTTSSGDSKAPAPSRRRAKTTSTLKSGRTIAATREHLETASERRAAHRKSRRRQRTRLVTVSIIFSVFVLCMVVLYFQFASHAQPEVPTAAAEATVTYQPTIEIIDEDGATISATGGSADHITSVTKAYIGQAEQDFRDLGYTPVKAVLPTGSIRQVNFYLSGYPGYIKLYTDRPTAESVEDADRLIRYLKTQNITNFEYLDVRLPEKAYWK